MMNKLRSLVMISLVGTVTFFGWHGLSDAKVLDTRAKSKQKSSNTLSRANVERIQANKKRCMWFFPICLVKRTDDTNG